jgi:hypothetical protein
MARGLLVDTSKGGTAAWVYYVNMVPDYWQNNPMVIFDVEEQYVQKIYIPLPRKQDYAIMKMPGTLFSYIPIHTLGFLNLPGFPLYRQGPIGFFS